MEHSSERPILAVVPPYIDLLVNYKHFKCFYNPYHYVQVLCFAVFIQVWERNITWNKLLR